MALAPSVTAPSFSCNEHELVAAVRQGSDRAFEELYSRYRSRISSYIYGMVGDHGRAEDIAQEVFISALRRLRETERPIAFKPWIYEIAKNACIDEFRRSRRAREVPLEHDEHAEPAIESWRPGPDAAMAHKQSLSDLKGAFHGLSESHHKVIVMRELEGLSYDQIGERLGMTRPVVESTLFRARKRLSEEYNELVSGRRCEHVQVLITGEQRRSLIKLGVRERRQLARHLAHCQPCRREARMAGVDESFFKAPKTLAGKIAALLPFPWLRWRRSHGGNEDAASASGSHSWNAVQTAQTVSRLVDPSGPAAGLGRAAAAAAAIAVAGIGSGVVTGAVGSQGHSSRPAATAARVSAAAPALASRSGRSTSAASAAQAGHSQQSAATGRAAGKTGGSGGSSSKPSSGGGSGTPASAGGQSSGGGGGGLSSGGGSSSGGSGNAKTGGSHTGGSSSLPGVKLPAPKLPTVSTGGLPLPKLTTPQLPQLPKVQLPTVSVPTVSVPGVHLPDPNKLLGKLTGG